MVMFDLAWMMSKDLNDMLWYVGPIRTSAVLGFFLQVPLSSHSENRVWRKTSLCGFHQEYRTQLLSGNLHSPGFLPQTLD